MGRDKDDAQYMRYHRRVQDMTTDELTLALIRLATTTYKLQKARRELAEARSRLSDIKALD